MKRTVIIIESKEKLPYDAILKASENLLRVAASKPEATYIDLITDNGLNYAVNVTDDSTEMKFALKG